MRKLKVIPFCLKASWELIDETESLVKEINNLNIIFKELLNEQN